MPDTLNSETKAALRIPAPERGVNLTVAAEAGAALQFAFDPSEASDINRDGNDLVFFLENGSSVTISDFFATGDEELPRLTMPDGVSVASSDFLAAYDVDVTPAAGAGAAGGGAGEYSDDPGAFTVGVDRLGDNDTFGWDNEFATTVQDFGVAPTAYALADIPGIGITPPGGNETPPGGGETPPGGGETPPGGGEDPNPPIAGTPAWKNSSNALTVDEAYLDRAADPGSKAGKTPESGKPGNTDEGSLVFTSPEGVDSITINGIPCTVEKSGDAYTVTIPAGAPSIKTTMEVGEGKSIELGEISDIRLEYSADSGEYTLSYTYTQLDNYGKHEGQGTISKPDADGFEVIIADPNGEFITGNVSVEIVDDVPTANNDVYGLDGNTASVEGNVLDNDVFGADGQQSGNYISWAGDVEGAPKDDQGRTIIAGKNGTLHVDQEGNFEYVPNQNGGSILGQGGFPSNIHGNGKNVFEHNNVEYVFKPVEITDSDTGAHQDNKKLKLDVTNGNSGLLGIKNTADSGNSEQYKYIGSDGACVEGVMIDCNPGAGNLSVSYVDLAATESIMYLVYVDGVAQGPFTKYGNESGSGSIDLEDFGNITGVLVYPGANSNFKLGDVATNSGPNMGGDSFDYTIYDGDGDKDTGQLVFASGSLAGGEKADSIHGSASDEIIFGDASEADAAVLAAGVSNYLDALAGQDELSEAGKLAQSLLESAEGGDDLIKGGAGDDIIFGMGGNDVIYGGQGEDIMFGGQGSNTFAWALDDLDGKTDKIMDFSLEDDNLRFDFEGADLEISALSANELKLTVTGPGDAEVTIDIHLDGNGLNGVENLGFVNAEGFNASDQMQAEILQMIIANGGA